jgi:short-subunit dehydrogenase
MPSRPLTLVTGASSGIGLELARLFAAEGDDVALVARRADRLEALAREIADRHGVTVLPIAADLADPAAPARILEELAGQGRAPDIVVNNAGFGLVGSAAKLPVDRQLQMIDVNVRALTELTLRTLPGMIERRRGGVLNVGSVAGFLPGPGMAIYFATKAFVLSFSEALAEEVRPHGVTVTAVCPGPTATEFQAVSGGRGSAGKIVPAMTGEEVAIIGHQGFRAGKTLVVTGGRNRIVAAAVPRLFPRSVLRKLVLWQQGRHD